MSVRRGSTSLRGDVTARSAAASPPPAGSPHAVPSLRPSASEPSLLHRRHTSYENAAASAASLPVPTVRGAAQGAVTPVELAAALVHAIRHTAPVCPPPPDDRSMNLYSQRLQPTACGHPLPVLDEQLPTRERLSQVVMFELPCGSGTLRVQSTAPAVFLRILHWCRVTPDEFCADWISALGTLSEEQSKGKSGSSFVYSSQRRFLIKTLTEEESLSLRRLLPSYYGYLLKNPNTLLNLHLGLFTVTPQPADGSRVKPVYFTVLQNVGPTNPDLAIEAVFDLKGSTSGRVASEQERRTQQPVLKDNDFLDEKRDYTVGSLDYAILQAQIGRDTRWLSSNNIMDYSFLLMRCQCSSPAELNRLAYRCHLPPPASGAKSLDGSLVSPLSERCGESEQVPEPAPWPPRIGLNVLRSISSGSGGVVYFVGLIDILRDYNWARKMAHTLKTTVGGVADDALSTVPPDQYAERFRDFILTRCFARQKDVQWNYFLDPKHTDGERSRLHKDECIAPGDVVGRTQKDTLTLDLFNPGVKSLCVVQDVRPTWNASVLMDEGRVSVFSSRGAHGRETPDVSTVPASPTPGMRSGSPAPTHNPPLPRMRHGSLAGVLPSSRGHSPQVSPTHRSQRPASRMSMIEAGRSTPARPFDGAATLRIQGSETMAPTDDGAPEIPASPGRPRRMTRSSSGVKIPLLALDNTRGPTEQAGSDPQFFSYTCSSGCTRVNVVGPVAVGDFLVPSGKNDGTAVAVPLTCLAPPYAFGVVEAVCEAPKGCSPDATASKLSVVEALVEERYCYDPPLRWETLEVMEVTEVGTLFGVSQAVWTECTDAVSKSLTRSLILSTLDMSLVRLNQPVGRQVGDWAVVDWMQGLLTKDGVSSPVRPIDCPDVVPLCLQIASTQRRLVFAAHLEREKQEARRAYTQPPHVEAAAARPEEPPPPLADKQPPRRLRAGTEVGAQSARLLLPEEPRRRSVDAETDIGRAERSVGGKVLDWLYRDRSARGKLNKSLTGPLQARRVRQAYVRNLESSISKLFASKGLFRSVLLFLPVPSISRAARVCAQWQEQWHAPELWGEVLPRYGCYGQDYEHAPAPDLLRQTCPKDRRAFTFRVGERWVELFGLHDPDYALLKDRALHFARELGQYETLFDIAHPPHRVLRSISLFKREKRESVPSDARDHIWEMERAFQALNVDLGDSFRRTSQTLEFEVPVWSWQLHPAGSGSGSIRDRGKFSVVRTAPDMSAEAQGRIEVMSEVVGCTTPDGAWIRLADGSGFVKREGAGVVWRRAAEAAYPPGPGPTREQLIEMRRTVVLWLDRMDDLRYSKVSWEGPGLLVRFQKRSDSDIVQRQHAAVGALKLGFRCKYYAAQKPRVFQFRRRVLGWKAVCDRVFHCFPASGCLSVLRTPNRDPACMPEATHRVYTTLAEDARQTCAALARSLDGMMFPSGEGHAVPVHIGDRPAGRAPVAAAKPRASAEPLGERLVEVYDLKNSELIKISGQVFPVFIVSGTTVLALTEANEGPVRLSPPMADSNPHGHVCLEGHSGLEQYLICDLKAVQCGPDRLRRLFFSIDLIVSADGTATSYYTVWTEGQQLPDGTPYGSSNLWVCEKLRKLEHQIRDVLSGLKDHLNPLDETAQRELAQAVESSMVGEPPPAAAGEAADCATGRSAATGGGELSPDELHRYPTLPMVSRDPPTADTPEAASPFTHGGILASPAAPPDVLPHGQSQSMTTSGFISTTVDDSSGFRSPKGASEAQDVSASTPGAT
eukprot:TRINITY_DN5630_c1_g1_i1.p1 TRINITY_DN5630_c1_g1~~TRINITY_DN5630_c1_g1_i1.p1  ORF type:complete len:1754 (+),score=514.20 TRINITY_DN5630_c1_g1_i1:101-5362(+)